jgi:hypothetical protein
MKTMAMSLLPKSPDNSKDKIQKKNKIKTTQRSSKNIGP